MLSLDSAIITVSPFCVAKYALNYRRKRSPACATIYTAVVCDGLLKHTPLAAADLREQSADYDLE